MGERTGCQERDREGRCEWGFKSIIEALTTNESGGFKGGSSGMLYSRRRFSQ